MCADGRAEAAGRGAVTYLREVRDVEAADGPGELPLLLATWRQDVPHLYRPLGSHYLSVADTCQTATARGGEATSKRSVHAVLLRDSSQEQQLSPRKTAEHHNTDEHACVHAL